MCAGHETLILDFGTVENVCRMVPKEVSVEAKRAFALMAAKIRAGDRLGEEEIELVSKLDQKLEEVGERRCQEAVEEISREIDRFKPHFVGFKLWNGDGFTGTIRIAEQLKSRYKNLKIVGGGPHVDVFGGDIYRATDVFDCLVYGEGEETILQLAEFARGRRRLNEVDNVILKQVSGAVVRTRCQRVSDLNALPLPRYDEHIYPAMAGNNKIRIMVLDESRGCPYACHFCIHPFKSGRGVRCKEASRVIEEMRWIQGQTGARAFRYAGSSTPAELAKAIGDLVVREGLRVEYAGFGNFREAVPEYFPLLRSSGCRSLAFGMESGSETILREAMGKPIRLDRMREVIEASKKAGIFTVVFLIFPAPFETRETEAKTLAFLRETRPDSATVVFPAIYPQTKWAKERERFGFAFDEAEYSDAAMSYKAKTLFPMDFWHDLPYKLSGRSFREIMNETARFTGLIEHEGITTSVSDDFAIMAELGGYGGEEKKLRDHGRLWFFTGDAERIQEFVEVVNSNATALGPEKSVARNIAKECQ